MKRKLNHPKGLKKRVVKADGDKRHIFIQLSYWKKVANVCGKITVPVANISSIKQSIHLF